MVGRKPNRIFLIIGLLLLALAVATGYKQGSFSWWGFTSNALLNIAFVLLTVVIVDYLWGAMGGEPISNLIGQLRSSTELIEDAFNSGGRRLLHASGTFGDHGKWMARLRRAESKLDLMGYTLHVWSKGEGFEGQRVKLIDRGVRCRVLIMAPENPHYDAVVNEEIGGVTKTATAGESSGAQQLFQRIADKVKNLKTPKGSFEFRQAIRGTVLCQICRVDDEMTVIQYLYSAVASVTPMVVVRGTESGLFKVYSEEFESLWTLNDPQTPPDPEPAKGVVAVPEGA